MTKTGPSVVIHIDRYRAFNQLAAGNLAHIGVPTANTCSKDMIRKLFAVGIFHVRLCIYYYPIFAIPAITHSVEFERDATAVKWFLSEYVKSKFIYTSPTPGVTRKRADGTEVPNGSQDEVSQLYGKGIAVYGTFCNFGKRASRLFLCERQRLYGIFNLR